MINDRKPMTHSNSNASIRRLATTAGIVSSIAGTALLGAPDRVGPVIGLTEKRDAQVVAPLTSPSPLYCYGVGLNGRG